VPTAAAPDRLVRIEPGNSNQIAYPNYRDIVRGDIFDGLAAYAMTRLNLRTGSEIEKISGMLVSPEFFRRVGISWWSPARPRRRPRIPAVKRALGEVDRTATAEVRPIRDVTSLEFSIRRMGTWLLGESADWVWHWRWWDSTA
jgi:hypothetical protein